VISFSIACAAVLIVTVSTGADVADLLEVVLEDAGCCGATFVVSLAAAVACACTLLIALTIRTPRSQYRQISFLNSGLGSK
jgi:hypothetical protein